MEFIYCQICTPIALDIHCPPDTNRSIDTTHSGRHFISAQSRTPLELRSGQRGRASSMLKSHAIVALKIDVRLPLTVRYLLGDESEIAAKSAKTSGT